MTILRSISALGILLISAGYLLFATVTSSPDPESLTQDSQDPENIPRVRLRLSGQLEGYLEPCGCASAQLGGLARRSFMIQQDRNFDLLIEGGNLATGNTILDEFKIMTFLQVLGNKATSYHALGIGPKDLELGAEGLAGFLANQPVPALSSDLRPAEGEQWPLRAYVEHQVGNTTVRIAALTLRSPNQDFTLLSPEQAWQAGMEGVDPATLRVLLVHGSEGDARAQAGLRPTPDLLVSIGASHAEPPSTFDVVNGVPLVFPGIHGRFLLDVTLVRAHGKPEIRAYRPIPLTGSRTAKGAMEDKDVRSLILQHRFDVREYGIREELAERLPRRSEATYIGSETCAACHPAAGQVWRESKHGHAWQTLVDAETSGRYDWPVTFYPDCIACHVVAYGEKGGFINPEKTPRLMDVGCEQCHGPGSEHVRMAGKHSLGPVGPRLCMTCHTYEQSPDFDYGERWKMIEHGLK